jgi:hypothetical protein
VDSLLSGNPRETKIATCRCLRKGYSYYASNGWNIETTPGFSHRSSAAYATPKKRSSTAIADGKNITQKSHYDDPIRGSMTWRSVTKIVDENTHLFEMFATDKSGKEEKMMEITYSRKS